MGRILSYTFVVALPIMRMCLLGVPATSHKMPTLFAKYQDAYTHLDDPGNYADQPPLEAERRFNQPSSDFYYGSAPTDAPPASAPNAGAEPASEGGAGVNQAGTGDSAAPQELTKQDLSAEAYKLQDEAKSLEQSKDKLEEVERSEKELSEQLKDTNYQKLNELTKKRNALVNKISAVAKTLRREHDKTHPGRRAKTHSTAEMREQPIVLVAKTREDEKRKANQLAHLEGFEDFMHHITSPCNLMEELREKSEESKKSSFREKFETEQKILDSMSMQERLNYDRNMIDHYESIMQEIEQGIRNAEDEINKSWNHFED